MIYLLLAFVAGSASVLAFAPFDWPWAALVSLVLLFWLWQESDTRLATKLGFAYGLGLMGFGVFWLHNSIGQFGGLNPPLAIAATLLFATVIASFFALAGYLAKRLGGNPLIVYPAVWVLVEWLRGWFLTGFPWLSLGYSQIDRPLAGFTPIVGVYGVSGLMALSAMLLLRWRSPTVLLLPAIWVGGHYLLDYRWTEPAGEPFNAALVQGNIPQQLKWQPEQLQSTVETYVKLSAALEKSKLVVWPETAIPTLASNLEVALLAPMNDAYAEHGRDILMGIPVQDEDGRFFNSMLSLGASGRGRYDKRHLVPFGEFMPLKIIMQPLARLLAIPMSDFSAGSDDAPPVVQLAGHPAGISICYEDAFGGEVAKALPDAHFLVNASNDAWFGDSLAPHQHLQIARMRALETGRYLLRATNTGISAIVDDKGRALSFLGQSEQGEVQALVQPMQGHTPFSRFGNWPLLLLTIAILALSLWLSNPNKSRSHA